jgi:hypothetical protein
MNGELVPGEQGCALVAPCPWWLLRISVAGVVDTSDSND